MTRVPYPYWNLKLRDDSNILDIANSIASDSSGHLFSELLSASRTNLSAVSPNNTGIVFIDIAIILSFCGAKIRNFRYLRKDLLKKVQNYQGQRIDAACSRHEVWRDKHWSLISFELAVA